MTPWISKIQSGTELDHRTIRNDLIFVEVTKEMLNKKRRKTDGMDWDPTDHKTYKLDIRNRIWQLKGTSSSKSISTDAERKCKVIEQIWIDVA